MDTAQWPQGIEVINNKAMESGARPPIPPLPSSTTNTNNMVERRIGGGGTQVRPQKEQALNCPRCNSSNTKFCYYNNYSLSQPRYFCKTCRRYWTEGGSLRNVPVGGGSRKNKRPTPPSSSSSIPTPTPSKKLPDPHAFSDHHHHQLHIQNPSHKMMNNFHAGQDLNLGFPPLSGENYNATMPHAYNNTSTNPSSSSSLSAMELLKNSAGLGPIYSSGYGNLQEYKPPSGAQALNFTLDGFDQSGGGGGYGVQVHQESNTTSASCRLLFPFEDLKQQVSSTGHDQGGGGHHGDASTAGYWNGMLGGGSW